MGENRNALIILIVCLVLGVVFFYIRDAQTPPEEPVRILYESKGGAVIFDHAAHSARLEEDCWVCHHMDGDEPEKDNCRDCHIDNEIPIMHAYHEKGEDFLEEEDYSSCMSCHEANGRSPKNCKGCHK